VRSHLDRGIHRSNMQYQLCVATAITVVFLAAAHNSSAQTASDQNGYPALVKLFQQWREFEHPVMKNNVPDYSASAMAAGCN
jgi:hypothetical protein